MTNYYCNVCRFSLRNRAAWRRHARHHNRQRSSGYYGSYSAHNRRHHHHYPEHHYPERGDTNEHRRRTTYICCECRREYRGLSTLNTHCCECHQTFRNKARLEDHQASHLNIHQSSARHHLQQLPLHRCLLCPATYSESWQLTAHQQRHRLVHCIVADGCRWYFIRPEDMIEHFDVGGCGSGMSLTRAYTHAQPHVRRGGPVTRARAERWVARHFEKNGMQPEEPQDGDQSQVQWGSPTDPLQAASGSPSSATLAALASASPLVAPADNIGSGH
ncbi:hypothetical protein F5Y13DRAFT_190849 [Hypoxylon sp. FL1857]|nr:hypothetical protein F5Y13DRAFT_190849 [Hypoxylon sp. FL1857]